MRLSAPPLRAQRCSGPRPTLTPERAKHQGEPKPCAPPPRHNGFTLALSPKRVAPLASNQQQAVTKQCSVAPEHAEKKGQKSGAEEGSSAAVKQGVLHPHSWRVYNIVLQYFNKRLDTEGIKEDDSQLKKLGRLLFVKHKVHLQDDHYRDTMLAARLISARCAYSRKYQLAPAVVTVGDLWNSEEGLDYWIGSVDQSPGDVPAEHVLTVASPEDSATRISSILEHRELWLWTQGLDKTSVMNLRQRDMFLKWSMDEYFKEQSEHDHEEDKCEEEKSTLQKQRERRWRFSREQRRRAGSAELWMLLSFTGGVSEDHLREALQNPVDNGSASERSATPSPCRASRRASKRSRSTKRRRQDGPSTCNRLVENKDFQRKRWPVLKQCRPGV